MKKITQLTVLALFCTTALVAQEQAPKAEPCDELNVLEGKLKEHFAAQVKPVLIEEQARLMEYLSEAEVDTLKALRNRQAALDVAFQAYEEKVASLAEEGSAKAAFEGSTAAMAQDIRSRQMALNAQLNALYLSHQEAIDGQMQSLIDQIEPWEEQREALRADYMEVPCVAAHFNPEQPTQSVVEKAQAKQEKQEKALIKNPNNAGKKVTLDDVTIKKIDPSKIGNAKLSKALADAEEEAPAAPQQEVVRDEQDLAYRNQGEEIIRIRRTAAFLLWDAKVAGYTAPKYFFAW